MRAIDPTLTAALAAGKGTPFLKGYIGYTDGTVLHSDLVYRYKLTGSTLEFEMPYTADVASDQTAMWLERGVTIAGTDYTLTTGRFRILSQHYLPNGRQVASGALFPKQYYAAAGDLTYKQVIDAFCTNFGKTAVYRDPAAAWLSYQFLPTGKAIIMNDANFFAALLRQKYLIFLCDKGSEQVLFYSCAGSLGTADITVSPVNDFFRDLSQRSARCFIWRDELQTVHTSGSVTDPLHNLGFLPSTASAPARKSAANLFQAVTRPELCVLDGDIVSVSAMGGSAKGFALVTEEYDPGSGHKPPRWETAITANEVFGNTEGGALPSTIERVSNYTPLNTSNFDGVLGTHDNNLQAAMDTLDEKAIGVIGAHALRQTVAAGATQYIAPFVNGLSANTWNTNWPRAGLLRRMYVRIANAQPATGTLVITLQVAGVDTALVVTIPAGSAAGNYSDLTHSVTIATGNGLRWKIVNNAGAASAQIEGLTLQLD